MPSSPIGPCSSGSTTVRSSAVGGVGEHRRRRRSTAPTGRAGRAARRARRPAPRWAPRPSAHSPSVEMPIGVTRYRAGSTAAQHVGGGRAADVVLGRLPAEQHDEVDPLDPSATHLRRDGTVRRREDSGHPTSAAATGGTLRRARRRARRGVVRLPHAAARPAVRADRRRPRRPRLHRRRASPRAPAAYLTSRPDAPATGDRRSRSPTRAAR